MQIALDCHPIFGGVSDLDTVIRNPADSQHVKATYIHIWNTTRKGFHCR
jgi:hypothetical protein